MKHISLLFSLLCLLVNCTSYDNEPYEEGKTRFSEMANQTFTYAMQMLPEILSTRAKTSDSFYTTMSYNGATFDCRIVWDMEDNIVVYAFGGVSCRKEGEYPDHTYRFGQTDTHISEIASHKIAIIVRGNLFEETLQGMHVSKYKLTIYGYIDPRSYLGEFTVVEVQDGRWEIE